MTPRRALWTLIALTGALRLAWAASLGLGIDEAYHYLFSVHPAWAYFDHPPMLAAVEAAGLALAGGRVSPLSLRLGFVLLFAGSTWLMARLTARSYGDLAGLLAAFALNVSAYHTAAAGAFALPDGPLLFFWLLTLDRLDVALRSPPRLGPWVAVGLAWGGALLSKYHAVFLPAGLLLYLLLDRDRRRWLARPGPYLGVAVGLLAFAPVVYWNATHGWASFAFQGARAVGAGGFRPGSLAGAVFLPALYLFPWVWLGLVGVLWRGLRAVRAGVATGTDKFLLAEAVVPLGVFLAIACTRPVLPHWTLVGFVALFPMLGRSWAASWGADPARFRRRAAWLAALPVVSALALAFQAQTGFFQEGRPGGVGLLRASNDPTADMVGWDSVAAELRRRGLLDRPGTFLFTSHWFHSGELAFATRGSGTPVLCYNPRDARSFAFWSRPADWVGRDGLLVAVNDSSSEPECYAPWFTRIEPLGDFAVERAGAPVRKVRLFRCVGQTRPFPFDDLGATPRPGPGRGAESVAAGPGEALPVR